MQALYPRTDTFPPTNVKELPEMWPQCGAVTPPTHFTGASVAVRAAVANSKIFRPLRVDIRKGRSLYSADTACRPRERRDGAPPKLLTIRGRKASDQNRGLAASTALGSAEGWDDHRPGLFDR